MNIKPINRNSICFLADTKTINSETGEYKDPLMRWPLRGAAFTNEIGEALRPLIGKYATLTWAPALLYIGADIYDKYKNDQTEYSPDSKRCLKQACFQGLASIILPIIAVKGGQNLFSILGLISRENLTFNAQEDIVNLAQQFVANGKLHAYKNDSEACVKEFIDIIHNNIDYKDNESLMNNHLKKIIGKCKLNTKENIEKYATQNITKLIRFRKQLLEPSDNMKKSAFYEKYKYALELGQTKNVAVKSTLNKYLSSKTMKGRFIKTSGGFLALGLAIKPIDYFVEHVLIGKVIGPGIDKTTKRPVA